MMVLLSHGSISRLMSLLTKHNQSDRMNKHSVGLKDGSLIKGKEEVRGVISLQVSKALFESRPGQYLPSLAQSFCRLLSAAVLSI